MRSQVSRGEGRARRSGGDKNPAHTATSLPLFPPRPPPSRPSCSEAPRAQPCPQLLPDRQPVPLPRRWSRERGRKRHVHVRSARCVWRHCCAPTIAPAICTAHGSVTPPPDASVGVRSISRDVSRQRGTRRAARAQGESWGRSRWLRPCSRPCCGAGGSASRRAARSGGW